MKIRRTFVLGLPDPWDKEKKSVYVFTAVPIAYKRERHIIEKQTETAIYEKNLLFGSIFNLRYEPTKYWAFEITTGLENESLRTKGKRGAPPSVFKASRTGLDDIVLEAEKTVFLSKTSQIVIYGLTGFPTKRKVTLQEKHDPLVGTRFFSIGVGSEFSHDFIHGLKESFIFVFQNRFLHFFNRRFEPILPHDAKIQPGNLIDLLFAMQYRYRNNLFEVGYNPTFFTNQAILFEDLRSFATQKDKNFTLHSVYGSYAHFVKELPIFKRSAVIGSGLNIGRSNRFDTKIWYLWVSFSLIF